MWFTGSMESTALRRDRITALKAALERAEAATRERTETMRKLLDEAKAQEARAEGAEREREALRANAIKNGEQCQIWKERAERAEASARTWKRSAKAWKDDFERAEAERARLASFLRDLRDHFANSGLQRQVDLLLSTTERNGATKYGWKHADDGTPCMEPAWCQREHHRTPSTERSDDE